MRNFFEAIEAGVQPVSDVASTVNGMNICHMANICLKVGKTLRWNQEKFEFDDAAANAEIARPARPGYEIKG